MCGLAGYTFDATASRDHAAIIDSMLQRIAHRGPDERDSLILGNLVLGHNRLSIMEPEGGAQPRVSADGSVGLIFNGEIYNHREFHQQIVADGGELRDHCDTETLFWLLRLYGVESTLAQVDGMFAFAWYQRSDETLCLARDRFGQKPLYFAEVGGQLIFGSEIKALRMHPGLAEVAPDLSALQLYLMMEYVPGPATGLTGIQELPAGHLLTYRRGNLQIKPYWQPADVSRAPGIGEVDAVRQLDERLNNAVSQQLVADVPLGIFLSGGLDSSLIAAIARRHKQDVATFTVKFPYASFDESAHARTVADHIGTRHTTVELDRQSCTDGLARLLTETDQPFADSSMLPSYLLCEATKRYVTVALGGDGADELFLGYPNFKLLRATRMMAAMPAICARAVRALSQLWPGSGDYMNMSFLLRQLSYGIGRPPAAQSIYWMSAVPADAQEALWRQPVRNDQQVLQAVCRQLPTAPGLSLTEQCQRHFINYYLANDILQKMDRASMYNSLEVRSPFLANGVSESALALPTEMLFKKNQGKVLLRALGERYLPQSIIRRRKHGFALPVSKLLRGDLRDVAAQTLLDKSNPIYQYLEMAVIDEWWSQHMKKKADRGKSLWALLMLAAFFRNQS